MAGEALYIGEGFPAKGYYVPLKL